MAELFSLMFFRVRSKIGRMTTAPTFILYFLAIAKVVWPTSNEAIRMPQIIASRLSQKTKKRIEANLEAKLSSICADNSLKPSLKFTKRTHRDLPVSPPSVAAAPMCTLTEGLEEESRCRVLEASRRLHFAAALAAANEESRRREDVDRPRLRIGNREGLHGRPGSFDCGRGGLAQDDGSGGRNGRRSG